MGYQAGRIAPAEFSLMVQGKEILALELPQDEDLSLLCRWLWQRSVPHRVYERGGNQYLVVFDHSQVDEVARGYAALKGGHLKLEPMPVQVGASKAPPAWLNHLRAAPLCLALVAACIIGALLASLDGGGRILSLLTFTSFRIDSGGLVFSTLQSTLHSGQLWRLMTPVFLHFGALHFVFNMLWLWEIGRRVEGMQSAGRLLALIVLCGVGGNVCQYLYSGSALFGGMSGVIYGLLGYTWLWGRLRPSEHFRLAPGIMVVMMIWLVVCAVGLIEALGFGAIANAAHLSGLMLGLFSAVLLALVSPRIN